MYIYIQSYESISTDEYVVRNVCSWNAMHRLLIRVTIGNVILSENVGGFDVSGNTFEYIYICRSGGGHIRLDALTTTDDGQRDDNARTKNNDADISKPISKPSSNVLSLKGPPAV